MHSVCLVELHVNVNLYKSIECCTIMLFWRIYVTSNNTTYVGLRVKCPMLHRNTIMFVCLRPSLDVQFAEQIVMTDKSWSSFSVFVKCSRKTFYGITRN